MQRFDPEFAAEVRRRRDIFRVFGGNSEWLVFTAKNREGAARIEDEGRMDDHEATDALFIFHKDDGEWYLFGKGNEPNFYDHNVENDREGLDLTQFLFAHPELRMPVARYCLEDSDFLYQIESDDIFYAPEEREICFYANETALSSFIEDYDFKRALEAVRSGDGYSWFEVGVYTPEDDLPISDENAETLQKIRSAAEDLDEDDIEHIEDSIENALHEAERDGVQYGGENKVYDMFYESLADNGWIKEGPESWYTYESPSNIVDYYMKYIEADFEGLPKLDASYPIYGIHEFDEDAFNETLSGSLSEVLFDIKEIQEKGQEKLDL
jgi:hypothetical protein